MACRLGAAPSGAGFGDLRALAGAIAVARHPNGFGWIIGVALGKGSATEADALAIGQCRKVGLVSL
jgi:hypothetical protein